MHLFLTQTQVILSVPEKSERGDVRSLRRDQRRGPYFLIEALLPVFLIRRPLCSKALHKSEIRPSNCLDGSLLHDTIAVKQGHMRRKARSSAKIHRFAKQPAVSWLTPRWTGQCGMLISGKNACQWSMKTSPATSYRELLHEKQHRSGPQARSVPLQQLHPTNAATPSTKYRIVGVGITRYRARRPHGRSRTHRTGRRAPERWSVRTDRSARWLGSEDCRGCGW